MNKNVLIIGNNKRNVDVGDYFAKKGYNPVVIDDVKQLRSLDGEVGYFTARTKKEDIIAKFAVLTEQPVAKIAVVDGVSAFSIYQDASSVIKPKADVKEPVVFLLDYVCESPLSATIHALQEAVKLARRKRKVNYLAKFVRTAGVGVEALYRDAREAGVTFVKYETLSLSANENSEEFSLNASDGVFDVEVNTKTIFVDAGFEIGDSFKHAVKSLKLTVNENGFVAEDTYYLSPALTDRRGVYYISRNLAAEKLEEGLEYIASCAKSDIWDKPSAGTAVIDGEKCVLCMNCVRACTHAALEPDTAARQMKSLASACAGCGSCASVCPGNAITLEKEAVPSCGCGKSSKVLVLCCENSASVAMENALLLLGDKAAMIESVSVPCGGRIGLEQLTDELNSYGKVMIAVCMDGACRHFNGNKRACGQTRRLKEMLEAAGLSQSAISFTQVSHVMPGVLRDDLADLVKGGD